MMWGRNRILCLLLYTRSYPMISFPGVALFAPSDPPDSAREWPGPFESERSAIRQAAQGMPTGAPGRPAARGGRSGRTGGPSGRPRPQERLRRRQVAQDPARTRVQAVLDGAHLRVRHFPEVRALGKVPPHQAVGVLVQAPFPGVVGPREEEVSAERPGHPRVVGELLAVVGRDRVDGEGSEHARHGRADRRRRLPAGPLEKGILRRPVHQRHHGAAVARAVDSCPPPGRRSAPSPPPAPGARGCPPGPGCGPGPRGPRPSGSASFPGGAGAARAGPRPCGRRGRAGMSTGAPPPGGPPGAAARRPARGSIPRPAAPPPAPPAPASSCWAPTGPRLGPPLRLGVPLAPGSAVAPDPARDR